MTILVYTAVHSAAPNYTAVTTLKSLKLLISRQSKSYQSVFELKIIDKLEAIK